MVGPANLFAAPPEPRPERRSDRVERALIERILDGTYPVGSTLPLERDLAADLDVGRPTLREALSRLERDGWISTQKGVGNTVLDYQRTGTLNTLGPILRTGSAYARKLVVHMLEVRAYLMPACARGAVQTNAARVAGLLAEAELLPDEAEAFARFDWHVNRQLCLLSPNPLFLLILEGMNPPYEHLSVAYFSDPKNRRASRRFYEGLSRASMDRDPEAAARVTDEAMRYATGWFEALEAALAPEPQGLAEARA